MERPVLVVLTMLVSAFMVQVEAKHHHHPQSPAPSPSVDCNSAILGLADCLSYVQKGSSTAKPEKSCCTSLEGLVKAGEVSCLCEAFKSSSSLGIPLDFNKALGLPSACGVSTPPFSECGISIGTGSAFAPAPSPTSGMTVGGVPASSPNSQTGGASAHSVGSYVILITIFIATYSLHY